MKRQFTSFRGLRFAAALLLGLASSAAMAAAPPVPFEQAAFARAQTEGRTIIVESYAFWCLPCRIQAPILERLRSSKEFGQVLIFRIGETSPRAAWKRFRLTGYGTLVVFRGGREVARGTPTDEARVRKLLAAGL